MHASSHHKKIGFFFEREVDLSRAVDGTTDGGLATDLAHGNLETQIGVDVNHDLDLAAGLDALDGELGNGLLSLPYNLADLFVLILLIGEVGVLVVSGLLLLGLGLRLGDLDIAGTLADADQNVTTLLGDGVLGDAAGGESGLGGNEGLEGSLAAGGELNTDGLGQVGGNGNHGVNGLLNILVVELLDQGGLESGTTSGQLRGVDGGEAGGGGQDGSSLGEDVLSQLGNLGGVRGTTGEDDLVNVKDIKLGLLDNLLDQAGELSKDLAGEELEASAVDGRTVVNTGSQRLNAQLSVGAQAESLAGTLTLQLKLGKATGILARVSLVLLDELLGEVVNDDLIQGSTTELVVVSSGQDGVHAAAAGNNGDVGAGATKVSDNDQLVGDSGLGASVVSHDSGDGLVNQLENINAGLLGGSDESLALSIGEVGGDGDDSGVDLLAEEIGGRLLQAAEVAGGDLGDSDSVGLLAGSVADGESHSGLALLGVGGSVGWGRVDGLELLAQVIPEVGDSVGRVADELGLSLGTVVLLTVDVGEDAGNLTVWEWSVS